MIHDHMAHFFMIKSGSKFRDHMAHFFIDIHKMDVKYLPNSWIISPFILGNISTAFLTSKSPLSQLRSFSETGRCACPYYIMQAHRFSNRLKTSL